MSRKPPKIAVLYDSTHILSRTVVHGILRYANAFGSFRIELLDLLDQTGLPTDCRGFIVSSPPAFFRKKIPQSNRPTVIVSSDTKAFGIKAAEFFLSRSPRTFAYVGMAEDAWWDRERGEAFATRIREAGFTVHLYESAAGSLPPTQEVTRLQKWLKSLPKPLAIFAANDARSRETLMACRRANIVIPHEATILGVDNDVCLCESMQPQLSSIPFRLEESGYEAARLLDALMKRRRKRSASKSKPNHFCEVMIPPGDVVERESTLDITVDHPAVSHALAFISLHKGLNIRPADIARETNLSLSWLEQCFKQKLGVSVITEINRVRLQTILHLIRKTDTPFTEIARLCGFTRTSTLCHLIKKETGNSMRTLRSGRCAQAVKERLTVGKIKKIATMKPSRLKHNSQVSGSQPSAPSLETTKNTERGEKI